jgi:hypothetical protein
MTFTTRRSIARRAPACLFAGALGIAGHSAFAQTAAANAYDIQAHVSVAGLLNLDIAPIKQSLMTPQADAFELQDQLQDWSEGDAAANVSAGTLQSAVQWQPSAAQFIGGAEANAAHVAVSAVSLLGASLIEIAADQVHALTLISGQCPSQPSAVPTRGPQPNDLGDQISNLLYGNGFDAPSLLPVRSIELPGLQVSILGIPVPDLPLNPPPNTGIDLHALGIAGATLVLNEQTTSGDSVNTLAMSANALHLTLDVAGLITADVTLGHADTSVNCAN